MTTSMNTPTPSMPSKPSMPSNSAITSTPERAFFHPTNALWWLYCLAVGLGTIYLVAAVVPALSSTQLAVGTVLPLIAVTAVIFGLVILVLDPFGARSGWLLLAGAVAGGTIATAVSLKGNEYIYATVPQILGAQAGSAWESALAGPMTEEWSKGLCILLIMLIAGAAVARPIHGLLIGAFVGLGFQIVENIIYAANGAFDNANSDLSGAWSTTILRSIIGVSSHWVWSAIAGVGVAIILGRIWGRFRTGLLTAVGLIVLGWFLHFFWNMPIGSGPVGMLVKAVLTLTALAFVVRWVWKQERDFLSEVPSSVDATRLPNPTPAMGDHEAR